MNFSVSEISERFVSLYGFDCHKLYCLTTGKPMGFIFAEELESVCNTLVGDLESQVDDLAIRLLASMRPSMKWNKMRVESLDEMRLSDPVETMAFMLNRLFTPGKDQRHYDFVTLHTDRIRVFKYLHSDFITLTPERRVLWDSVMLMLLEIEARWSCISEWPPFTCQSIFDSEDWLVELHNALTPWHKVRVAAFLAAERQAAWLVQNPGAKRAFFNSWMEAKPVSESTVKAQAKQKDNNFMAGLFDALAHPSSVATKPMSQRVDVSTIQPSKPVALVNTKMPVRFGVKKNG